MPVKRLMILGFIAAVVASIVAVTAGASPARAVECGPGCGGGGGQAYYCHAGALNYAGYKRDSVPGDGSSETGTVQMNYAIPTDLDSHANVYIGVNGSGGHWIQAGVVAFGDGTVKQYIEWNDGGGATDIYTGAATFGVNYSVKIIHNSNGTWSASVGGVTKGQFNIGAPTQTTWNIESEETAADGSSPLCNYVDGIFSNLSSSHGSQFFQGPDASNVDYIDNVTSTGFEAVEQ